MGSRAEPEMNTDRHGFWGEPDTIWLDAISNLRYYCAIAVHHERCGAGFHKRYRDEQHRERDTWFASNVHRRRYARAGNGKNNLLFGYQPSVYLTASASSGLAVTLASTTVSASLTSS